VARPVSASFFSRQERFASVGSTNDVVRGWLAEGVPEVCLAAADEQTAGRGRSGRAWVAPPGAGMLLSLGFRPVWLPPDRAWRLAASTSLAMADAAEEAGGLRDGTIQLKWPNDLVITDEAGPGDGDAAGSDAGSRAPGSGAAASDAAGFRKLGGVLGESDGLGTDDPRLIVGIGVNADWPAEAFPPELAGSMTSLRVASGGRPVDRVVLFEAFTSRLEARVEALRSGYFDVAGWVGRQATTGRLVHLSMPDGSEPEWHALGVDALSGALVVADPASEDGERRILSGEIVRLRLAGQV
jgi:BirA family biotin operon repressor/biotin-[acetyl-CoA-carboxylase] ligase